MNLDLGDVEIAIQADIIVDPNIDLGLKGITF
jgi:hypothetical protein